MLKIKTFKTFKNMNEELKNVEGEDLTKQQQLVVDDIQSIIQDGFNLSLKQMDMMENPVESIKSGIKFDFDVFLPSIQKNLQREHVWTELQKNAFIISLFKGIKIQPVSILIHNPRDEKNSSLRIYKVIDGKQRISAYISFVQNEFPLTYGKHKIYYKDLSKKDKSFINTYSFNCLIVYDYKETPLDDETLIKWFDMLNYSGTPQEQKHIDDLKDEVNKQKK